MEDNIGTEKDRVLVDRGEEGVVNNHYGLGVGVDNIAHLSDVEALEGRVGRRFEPHDLCVGLNCLLELINQVEIDERNLDARVGVQNSPHITLSASIDVVDTKDVISLFQGVHHSHSSCHARGKGKRICATLHGCQVTLEALSGWVADTCVFKSGHTRGSLRIGGRKVDGGTDTTEFFAGLISGVDQASGETAKQNRFRYLEEYLLVGVVLVEDKIVGRGVIHLNLLGVALRELGV